MVKKFLLQIVLLISISTQCFADNYARLLLYGNCITCHLENKSISAPSLYLIQQRYKSAFSDKKEFVEYMSHWVLNPSVEGSLMLDMIDKYEIMPQLGYDKYTLEKITAYIYDTDFN